MQKTTAPERMLSPADGVLLKADYLARRRRAKDITSRAQQEASRILTMATAEAEALKKAARADGFALGVLSCADIIAGWVEEQDRLYASLVEECKAQLHTHVMALFSDVAFIQHMAERWVSEVVPLNGKKVSVRAHHSFESNHDGFEQFFAERGMAVSVEYSDEPGFHFRCGQFVLELTPEKFAAVLSEQSLNRSRLRSKFSGLCDENRRRISEKLTEL